MLKKLVSTLLAMSMLLLVALPARGISDSVNISELPEYTRHDNFELSFSALSDSTPTARFFFKEEGGTYTQFGPTLTAYSGTVEVTGAQVSEEKKYFFKVEINGGTDSDETSVIYDISAPDPVDSYSKEQVAGGHYKLMWRNPDNSDFSRVFIYRSESTDFTADGSTKIGELGGSPDQEMTFEDVGLDSDKTYFYALRAVDKAGNGSGLVADPEVTATTEEEVVVTETEAEGEFIALPQEEGDEEGEVLGEEEDGEEEEEMVDGTPTPSPSPEGLRGAYDEAKTTLFGTTRGKLILGGALLLGFISYFVWRRR